MWHKDQILHVDIPGLYKFGLNFFSFLAFLTSYYCIWTFRVAPVTWESTCQCCRPRFNPWVQKIPWRRKWQPTPVFLPGKSHGQRSLAGYSPWDHKESEGTQLNCLSTPTGTIVYTGSHFPQLCALSLFIPLSLYNPICL